MSWLALPVWIASTGSRASVCAQDAGQRRRGRQGKQRGRQLDYKELSSLRDSTELPQQSLTSPPVVVDLLEIDQLLYKYS